MEQKNIEVQRKKGLNLMMKILITAIIPLIILVAFAGLAIRAVGVTVSDKLMRNIRMCWMLLRRIPDSMLRSAGIRPGWRLAL